MIRQAGWVCRRCATFALPLTRPVEAPQRSPPLRPPLARFVGTSSTGNATAEPDRTGVAVRTPASVPVRRADGRSRRQSQVRARRAPDPPPEPRGWQMRPSDVKLKEFLGPILINMRPGAGKAQARRVLVTRFLFWERRFCRLWKSLDGQTDSTPRPLQGEAMEELRALLKLENVEDMRAMWLAKPRRDRDRSWPGVLLAALTSRPEKAAQVLQALAEPTLMMPNAAYDTLCYLTRWSSTLPRDRRAEQEAALAGLLLHLLRIPRPPHLRDPNTAHKPFFRFPQWVVAAIVNASDPRMAAAIFAELRREGSWHDLARDTKLHIAARLALLWTHKTVAVALLEEALKDGIDLHDRRVAALATTLFRPPAHWSRGFQPAAELQWVGEVYERLIRLGLVPNIVTYTSMMRALCLNGELGVAWKIYWLMRDKGAVLDPHVFATILHGAKRAGNFKAVMRAITMASPDAFRVPVFWNDILDAIMFAAIQEHYHEKKRPLTRRGRGLPAYGSMVEVYAKFFKMDPLERLIPPDLRQKAAEEEELYRLDGVEWRWKDKLNTVIDMLPSSPPEELVQPGPDTLGIMLEGCLRALRPTDVMYFYQHFRFLIRIRDPVAASLLRLGSFPYDAVLRCIGPRNGMLRATLAVFSDMLRDAAHSKGATEVAAPVDTGGVVGSQDAVEVESAESAEPAMVSGAEIVASENEGDKLADTPICHPRPSQYTWAALMMAFVRQDRTSQAARLLQSMREFDTEPNAFMWTILLAGYAKARHTRAAMRILDKLDEQGDLLNPSLTSAVEHLPNKLAIYDRLQLRLEQRDAKLRELKAKAMAVLRSKQRLEWQSQPGSERRSKQQSMQPSKQPSRRQSRRQARRQPKPRSRLPYNSRSRSCGKLRYKPRYKLRYKPRYKPRSGWRVFLRWTQMYLRLARGTPFAPPTWPAISGNAITTEVTRSGKYGARLHWKSRSRYRILLRWMQIVPRSARARAEAVLPTTQPPTSSNAAEAKAGPHELLPPPPSSSTRSSNTSGAKPSKQYPTATRNDAAGAKPSKQYPTTARNISAGAKPSKQYPTTTKYDAAGAKSRKQYPTAARNVAAGAKPSKHYQTPTRNDAAGEKPSKHYPTMARNVDAGAKPGKQYPTMMRIDAAGANPSKQYPTTTRNSAAEKRPTPKRPTAKRETTPVQDPEPPKERARLEAAARAARKAGMPDEFVDMYDELLFMKDAEK